MVTDIETLFGPEALPEPWPELPPSGQWLRGSGWEVWLLDSVDANRREAVWVQPLSRNIETGALK